MKRVRATPLLTGLLCAFILASCTDEASERNGLRHSLARPAGLTAYPLDADITTASISSIRRNGIFIQIPAGLPNELASHLLARFQEASIARDLPLTPTGTIPELTIKGVARAGTAPTGTAIALVWEILGPDGKRVKLLNGDALIRSISTDAPNLHDPWAMVDEATLEEIADNAATDLANWYANRWLGVPPGSAPGFTTASLGQTEQPNAGPIDFTTPSLIQSPDSTPPAPLPGDARAPSAVPPIATNPITIASLAVPVPQSIDAREVVAERQSTPPVGRALFDVALGPSPGDGQLSLAAAVQVALLQASASSMERSQAYRVIGTVALDPGTPGKAQVKIEWTVFTKEGTALGTINQANEVDASAIAGRWGQIATDAGVAAATGILQLITPPPPHA